jgi:hypothetical protein
MLANVVLKPQAGLMPPADKRDTYDTRTALRLLRSTLVHETVFARILSLRLPQSLTLLVQANTFLRGPAVCVGPGVLLAPRLVIGDSGYPRLVGALFYRPLIKVDVPLLPDSALYHRLMLHVCESAASMTGTYVRDAPNICALYHSISVRIGPARNHMPDDLRTLLAEYTGSGFQVGATFYDDSEYASNRFLALSRGIPPDIGLSEVLDFTIGSAIGHPTLADYGYDPEIKRIAEPFCVALMDAVQSIPYPWQKLHFLRRFSVSWKSVGAPPVALLNTSAQYSAALASLLRDCRSSPLSDAQLDRSQANVLSTSCHRPALSATHATVMNRMYRRAQESASARFSLEDFDVKHFHAWFKENGSLALRK